MHDFGSGCSDFGCDLKGAGHCGSGFRTRHERRARIPDAVAALLLALAFLRLLAIALAAIGTATTAATATATTAFFALLRFRCRRGVCNLGRFNYGLVLHGLGGRALLRGLQLAQFLCAIFA